jgi:hypothetical protein
LLPPAREDHDDDDDVCLYINCLWESFFRSKDRRSERNITVSVASSSRALNNLFPYQQVESLTRQYSITDLIKSSEIMTDSVRRHFQVNPLVDKEYQSLNPIRRVAISNGEPTSYGSINHQNHRFGHENKRLSEPALHSNFSIDEFSDIQLKNEKNNPNRIMRTGRQRKKISSRSKGKVFSYVFDTCVECVMYLSFRLLFMIAG